MGETGGSAGRAVAAEASGGIWHEICLFVRQKGRDGTAARRRATISSRAQKTPTSLPEGLLVEGASRALRPEPQV